MPELPDVEATRRYLISAGLPGRTIAGVELLWPGAVRRPSPKDFESGLAGRTVREVRRRAKYLVVELDGPALVLHLRMTGSLLLSDTALERPRYTRNVFLLDAGRELRFVDPRKLGAMWLVRDESEVLGGLGPEPLDPAFTPEELQTRLAGRQAPAKALLCDQSLIAGIGNIYADEVLFQARVHPLRRGGDISKVEVARLHDAIVDRLREAVELLAPLVTGGGPPTESREGLAALLVQRSDGAGCSRCGGPISRVAVRGRSSYFCPSCQDR